MTTTAAFSSDVRHVLHPYTNLAQHERSGPLIMERGRGIYVYDSTGKEYIEGIAGLWCTNLGFGDEALIEAAERQLRRLSFYHVAAHKSTDVVIALAEKLLATAPSYSKAFFVSSGSEANDTQIKLAWYYNNALGRRAKKKIVSRERAFHGNSLGAGSLTGLAIHQRDFDLPLDFVRRTAAPYYYRDAEPGETEEAFGARLAAELEALIVREGPDTVAAFIAEPVNGAGGVIVPPRGYFAAVQAVLARYDVRFIVDEVICGLGRTGAMWGSQTFGLRAGSLSCAKGLAGGYLPIGAVLVDEPMYRAMVEQSEKLGSFGHGFTFGGNPVAAAVALRTLELYDERDIIGHVRRVAPRFEQRLRAFAGHPLVGDVRSVGLLGAVELVRDKRTKAAFGPEQHVGAACAALAEREGLIVRALGDTIAFCPPLVITEPELDELFARFAAALDATEALASRPA